MNIAMWASMGMGVWIGIVLGVWLAFGRICGFQTLWPRHPGSRAQEAPESVYLRPNPPWPRSSVPGPDWQRAGGEHLTRDDLNWLLRSSRQNGGRSLMYGEPGVHSVERVTPLKSGWVRYDCRMHVDSEGDAMLADFYICPTVNECRPQCAPLIMDGWTYVNARLTLEPLELLEPTR